MDNFSQAQGTGKDWYGDLFETIRERTYSSFLFPNVITSEEGNIKVAFAGRSGSATSFNATIGSNQFSAAIRRSNVGDIEDDYAHIGKINAAFVPESENIPVRIEYPQTASSTGWLDYIQINVRRSLVFNGEQMIFRDPKTLDSPTSTFELSSVDNNLSLIHI